MAERTWLKYKKVHGTKQTIHITVSVPLALKAAIRDLALSETIAQGEEVTASRVVASILLRDPKLKKLYQKYELDTASK